MSEEKNGQVTGEAVGSIEQGIVRPTEPSPRQDNPRKKQMDIILKNN
jgi:hypothetical protein